MAARSLSLLAATSLLLGACAVAPTPPQPELCRSLFERFDREERFSGVPLLTDESSVLSDPDLARYAQRLITNGCLTTNDDLQNLASLGPENVATRGLGAPIAPISVHLGVVTGISAEVWVRSVLSQYGYRVRSIGEQGLGRRLYVGPFAYRGDLERALATAIEAGFIAPYPTRF